MKPKIIMHTQISLDGRIKGFDNPEVVLLQSKKYS
ncbi:sRNA-binding regulator protein Hfq [Staphylococcus hominis]